MVKYVRWLPLHAASCTSQRVIARSSEAGCWPTAVQQLVVLLTAKIQNVASRALEREREIVVSYEECTLKMLRQVMAVAEKGGCMIERINVTGWAV